MRERLIELLQNIDYVFDDGKHSMRDAIEFTADYLLANGVIVLPCKKGDELYVLTSDSPLGYEKVKCKKITIAYREDVPCAKIYAPCVYDDWGSATWAFYPEDFGAKVFLTREEAERALKERRK